MIRQNILKKYFFIIIALFISQLIYTENITTGIKDTVYIGGFEIKILKNDQIDFIHAELVILYQTRDIASVIPYITARTIFTKSSQSKTPISKTLRALGNDYEIKYMADHLIFKINFLKKKFPKFIKFLSVLYKTHLLSEKDLKYEIKAITEEYKKNEQFKKRMGLFAAYKFLFKDQILGNNFFTLEQIKNCTINQVIVHYKGTYTPKNSSLFITGKLNTERIIGYVSNLLRTMPKRFRPVRKNKQIKVIGMKRPVILNIPGTITPTIIYLKIVKINKNNNYVSNIIINDILFKQNLINTINKKPVIYRFRRDLFISTDILNHRGLAVISNSVKINYRSIGKFLFLLYKEVKQMKMNVIDRRSYKRVFNYLYGRLKVNSRNYSSLIENEIKGFILTRNVTEDIQKNRKLLLKINNILNAEKTDSIQSKSQFSKYETIIIIGDLSQILKYLPKINAEVVNIN